LRPAIAALVSVLVTALVSLGGVTPVLAQQAPAPAPVSPEVGANGSVTFRIHAPSVTSVQLTSPGDMSVVPFGGALPMQKSESGLWQTTVEGVGSGTYRYAFIVDGVVVVDPSNRAVSESNRNVWSLVHVPGSPFMDQGDVPHGAVAEVHYPSGVREGQRRLHVYTPPGYERGEGEYPVFYLLHGAMDSDDAWTTVGRAGFILDNLIAARAAEPMVVVMPDGHIGPFTMGRSPMRLEAFAEEFASDIKPYIEANYRVSQARAKTAIAGLSMGGAHTLEIAMGDLSEYAYVGVFSSGVFGVGDSTDWQDRHASALANADARKGLELFWFATGEEDFLLETTHATVDLMKQQGFDVEYHESKGGHTWVNWREYLHTFAGRLFVSE
jgi:enterochelin esterase family protein